jgi:hypothetical protein
MNPNKCTAIVIIEDSKTGKTCRSLVSLGRSFSELNSIIEFDLPELDKIQVGFKIGAFLVKIREGLNSIVAHHSYHSFVGAINDLSNLMKNSFNLQVNLEITPELKEEIDSRRKKEPNQGTFIWYVEGAESSTKGN